MDTSNNIGSSRLCGPSWREVCTVVWTTEWILQPRDPVWAGPEPRLCVTWLHMPHSNRPMKTVFPASLSAPPLCPAVLRIFGYSLSLVPSVLHQRRLSLKTGSDPDVEWGFLAGYWGDSPLPLNYLSLNCFDYTDWRAHLLAFTPGSLWSALCHSHGSSLTWLLTDKQLSTATQPLLF